MSIARFLSEIAKASSALEDHAREQQVLDVTVSAQSGVAVRMYSEGTTIELYAEVEQLDATLLCWWFEIRDMGTDQWRLSGELLVDNGSGQRVAESLPEHAMASENELASLVSEMIPALLKLRYPTVD